MRGGSPLADDREDVAAALLRRYELSTRSGRRCTPTLSLFCAAEKAQHGGDLGHDVLLQPCDRSRNMRDPDTSTASIIVSSRLLVDLHVGFSTTAP